VVAALQSADAAVRSAACDCVHSLSRSVAALRTTLMDANVAPLLMKVVG